MRRRDFIISISGAAAAWPLAVRAQPGDRMRRIGVLMNSTADDAESQARLAAFRQGLQQLGWTDGRNVQLDARWGTGDVSRLRSVAEDLVASAPDAILAGVGGTVGPLMQATSTVPIVFAQAIDPVGAGFIASMARPGGNVTGFTQFEFTLSGKMAANSQGDRAQSYARCGPSKSSHRGWSWAVGRYPGCGILGRNRGESSWNSRCGRNRAWHQRICE
jgi:putative ABC transport system substrate-binding protein